MKKVDFKIIICTVFIISEEYRTMEEVSAEE